MEEIIQVDATPVYALDQVENELISAKIVLVDSFRSPFEYGGIPYDTSKETHVEIETIKGKKTRKWFHVIITRLSNGTYELVSYAS